MRLETLLITARSFEKDYTDEIVWKYSGEKNRGTEVYENKNVHSGF